ncbi:hypothetical protein ACLSNP_002760 [Enterococcus faecalis]
MKIPRLKIRTVLVSIALISFFGGGYSQAIAQETVDIESNVTTEFVMHNDLTQDQQSKIVKSVPQEVIQCDKENFILVYEETSPIIHVDSSTDMSSKVLENDRQSIIQTKKSTDVLYSEDGSVNTTRETELPKTGEYKGHAMFFCGIILLFIIFTVILILRKLKLISIIFIIFALGQGSLLGDAESNHILPEIKNHTLKKGDIYSPDIDVPGFEYIGYIHSKKCDNPKEKEQENIGTPDKETPDVKPIEPTEPDKNKEVERPDGNEKEEKEITEMGLAKVIYQGLKIGDEIQTGLLDPEKDYDYPYGIITSIEYKGRAIKPGDILDSLSGNIGDPIVFDDYSLDNFKVMVQLPQGEIIEYTWTNLDSYIYESQFKKDMQMFDIYLGASSWA